MNRTVCSLALLLSSCATSEANIARSPTTTSATSGDYGAALQALHDGPRKLTTAAEARLAALPEVPIEQGLAGLTFGMTMQQVIDVWGRPNGIWDRQDEVQLSIARSRFTFQQDRLKSISIHQADIAHLTIAGGKIRMGKAAPDLKALFPDGVVPADAEADAHVISVHGILIDLDERDGEIIAIELTREGHRLLTPRDAT